jgi:GrpB-like predicted nucleotidyltransferase (UPF0157 family)
MDKLNSDISFRRVAIKDMALFRRFRSEKALLQYILKDLDALIDQHGLSDISQIDDKLIMDIIDQKRKELKSANLIDVHNMPLADRVPLSKEYIIYNIDIAA